MTSTRHVYQVHVRATPQQVWRAITDPDVTRRYFHRTAITSSLEPGAGYRYVMDDGTDAVRGTIEVADPPRRLVMTWTALYDAALAAEPPSRVEWTIEEAGDGLVRVRLVHGDLGASPGTWASVRHGWSWILDGMKTLLETGEELPPATVDDPPEEPADEQWHRAQAIAANARAWELVERGDRSADEDDDLLAAAHASAFHWARAAGRGPEHAARAQHLLARAHVALGHGPEALRHARRCLDLVERAGLADFDLAYAHEAVARALARCGDRAGAEAAMAAARAVPVADPEDARLVEADLAVPMPAG